MLNSITKGNLGRKGLFYLTFPFKQSIIKVRVGTQGRELEAGIEAVDMKEHCLLACPLCISQHDLLYNPRSPDQEWCCHQSDGPSHINPQSSSQVSLVQRFFSLSFPLLKLSLEQTITGSLFIYLLQLFDNNLLTIIWLLT